MIRFAPALASLLLLVTVTGCAGGGLKSIPGDAMLIQQGSGKFAYTATDDGAVYVRDSASDRIVYQGRVNKGQRLEVDAPGDQITLDGQKIKPVDLKPGDTYQIFFKAGEMREYHPMMNP
jgi:hypothetical protein